MIAALIITGCLFGALLIRHVCCILAVRSLRMQLGELERGSHMELGTQIRQKDILALCRSLNELEKTRYKERLRYERAEKKLKQNIMSLAHDIRTPLTGAAGYVQLASECEEPEKQRRYLETAEERLKELEGLLEELFLYARLTSPEFELNLSDLQILPVLSDCLVGFYRQFEKRGISPEVEFESEGVRLQADEECLRRIFHNLIQNALLHGRGGIVIRQEEGCMFFENPVSETSRPDPEQIFERFYKADSARRKGSSGLGIFIVRELAERMGWDVRAELEGDWLRIIIQW